MSAAIPEPWRALVAEINGGRIPDGAAGIRDVDAPCDAFVPAGKPWEFAAGNGDCDTDGHYICAECTRISSEALRGRRDQCKECGEKMVKGPHGLECPKECDVPLHELAAREEAKRLAEPGASRKGAEDNCE